MDSVRKKGFVKSNTGIRKKELVTGMKMAVCKKCKARYSPLKYQSEQFCSLCLPPRKCLHGVSNFIDCDRCFQINRNPNMRIFPPMQKMRKV